MKSSAASKSAPSKSPKQRGDEDNKAEKTVGAIQIVGSTVKLNIDGNNPRTLGSTNEAFQLGFIQQLINMSSKGPEADQDATSCSIAIINSIDPQNELEAMLGAQMVAVHNASMTMARRLAHVDTLQQQDSAERALNKHSKAECVRFPKNYRYVGPEKIFPDLPSQSVPFEHFNLDIAVIVLEQEISIDPIPLSKGMEFEEGVPLVHPAYPADRRFLLSGDFTCQLISKRNGVWGTSCDTHGGSSGGPILVKEGGEYHLAGVIVGGMQRLINFAVPINAWINLSLDSSCP